MSIKISFDTGIIPIYCYENKVLCTADPQFYAKAVLLTSFNTASPSRLPSGL